MSQHRPAPAAIQSPEANPPISPVGCRNGRPAATTWRTLAAGCALLFAQALLAADAPAAPAAAAVPVPAGWVRIPSKGRSFIMGQEFAGHRWTYTFPEHPVSFTYDFLMCATPVTQAEFRQVTGTNPTLHSGDENRPIDNVSWFDAVAYCNALSERDHLSPVYHYTVVKRDQEGHIVDLTELSIDHQGEGYRLLTSAEYEFVTRAGTTGRWFFGDQDEDQGKAVDYAWCELNSEKTTHPVGQLKPNVFGVYDITGNLWMWCNDWYGGAYPTTPQTDPGGPATGDERIARGGAFKNDVNHERSAYHWQWAPQSRNFELGFRIARTVKPVSPAGPLALVEINQDTWYRIIACHSGKVLEIAAGEVSLNQGRQLEQNAVTGKDYQLFQFHQIQSGYYQIRVKSGGLVLQIKDDSLADHAPVELGKPTGQDNQLFTLVRDTNDSFSIIAKSSGYGLDVAGGVGAVGDHVPVIVYPPNNSLNHKFWIIPAEVADAKPIVAPLTKVPAYLPPFDAAAAGMTPLFDGKTLAGWVGDPAGWKVIDGAIVGVKDNQNLMTAGDFDDFRLIVSTIQVDSPTNHQGIGFWGEPLAAGKYGYGGCIDLMPPMNWTWDYTTNRGLNGFFKLSRDLDKDLGITRSEWTQAEILVNRSKGTIRMAVNGMEVLNYVDRNPGRLKRGPIGLQAHGGNREVRYKDIFIETRPRDDRLITLTN
jgi:formylglycine-generating enzyme required for sulfatase activity